MKDRIVANRYAVSAVESVKDDELSVLINDCQTLLTLLQTNIDFKKVILSRIISPGKKRQVISAFTDNAGLHDFWCSFFEILIAKKRDLILKLILEELIRLAYLKQGKRLVDLHLAREADEETLQAIRGKLKDIIKQDIECKITINPDLIGGFVAKTEDMLIDASVKGNLSRFVEKSIGSK